jgi:ankyrin repeat protein
VVAAAKAGDRAAVRKLIAARTNVNTAGSDGSTALLWAVYNSDLEMTKALLTAGAKPDTANRYGVTPLLQAARTGETPLIEALLNAGASANLGQPDGDTPLMAASRAGRVDAVRMLLAKGANVNAADPLQEQTSLMWAAAEGHADVVQALLEAGAKPDLRAKVTALTTRSHADHATGGFTALMWAARNGYADVVQALAKGGADLNVKNGDNASATMIAIANDRLDMANLLIDLGSDPNDGSLYMAVDQHDGTTDMRAKDGGLLRWDFENKVTTVDLINKLLAKGADPNKVFQGQLHSISMANPDNHNASPMQRAATASDVEVLKILIPKGGDVNKLTPAPVGRGASPRSPLMAALAGGRGASFGGGPGFGREGLPTWREPGSRKPIDAVKVLLDAGADPNVQLDDDGNTAMHQASQRNDLDMIKLLSQYKADLEVYNWVGQRPLDIAEEAWDNYKKGIPDAATLQAMQAGNPLPERKDPKLTVDLLREMMKLPPIPNEPATTTASASQGGR